MTPRSFTDATVRALAIPESGQRDYADSAVPGLCVRVGKTAKTFRLVVGTGPSRKRYTLGRYPDLTLAKAREKAKDILAAHRLAPEEPAALRFQDALDRFLAAYRRKESTRHETERLLSKHFSSLMAKPLDKIKAAEIAPIVDGLKPSEGKHALIAVKTFFKWNAGRGYIDRNPLANITPLPAGSARERVLSQDELRAVWQVCASPSPISRGFRGIVQLAILTGQRIGQLGALRGEFIDTANRAITWPGELMKGNRSHTIPYGDYTASVLPDDDGLLFPTRKGEPFNAWGSAKERLDKLCPLPHWTLHDLRRTYATGLAELRIAPHVIERLLDHRSGVISGVAAIYNRYSFMDEMRHAMQLWEKYLSKILDANASQS